MSDQNLKFDTLVIHGGQTPEQWKSATLAPIYDFQYTPTFIFFDAQGKEAWRNVGQLDVNQLKNSLK